MKRLVMIILIAVMVMSPFSVVDGADKQIQFPVGCGARPEPETSSRTV